MALSFRTENYVRQLNLNPKCNKNIMENVYRTLAHGGLWDNLHHVYEKAGVFGRNEALLASSLVQAEAL